MFILKLVMSDLSFMFAHFASRMNKELGPLRYKLAMSKPMSRGIVCSIVYRDYHVCIKNTVIPTDLIPLEMRYFNVGMDWLSQNGAIINYPDKWVTFKNSEQKDI